MPTRSGWSSCGASCATRNVNDWPFAPPGLPRSAAAVDTAVFDDHRRHHPGRARRRSSDGGGEPEQIRVGGGDAEPVPGARRAHPARPRLHRRTTTHAAGTAQRLAARRGPAPPPRLPAIAIISHGFWMRRYGGDPSVVGKDGRSGQRPRADRRRAGAGVRDCCSRRAPTSSACPTCGPRRGSTTRPRTGTTSPSAGIGRLQAGRDASSRRSCRPIASLPICASIFPIKQTAGLYFTRRADVRRPRQRRAAGDSRR